MEQIKNTGFEEGMPTNWQIYATGTKHKYTYPEIGRSGGPSMAIEYPIREIGKMASLIQSTQIDTTKKYKLSGWIKTENIKGAGASIKVDWKDATGKYLGESTIMKRQVGTISWKYFGGDVLPDPDADKAVIVLDLKDCSGKVWFDDVSIVDISESNTNVSTAHPNIYLNMNEINDIKTRKSIEPWRTPYNNLIAEANESLNLPIQSVTFSGKIPPSGDKHDYYSDVPSLTANRYDYFAASALGKAVRSLGLAYVLTGDVKYARKSVDLINGWCIRTETKMNPKFTKFNDQAYVELCITMPGMFYGADLIWNYTGWSESDKYAFKQWTQRFIVSAKTWSRGNNFENWRLVFISSASIIADDNVSFKYACDRWKALINTQMGVSGKMLSEIDRTNSLSYSTYAINGMIQTAEIARHNGVDLYNYKLADGRGLEKTLDFHAPYVTNPSSWPYKQVNPYNGDNAALYELAYTFKHKTSYKNAINKWKRPMYEKRVMGPVTLTHGSIFV